LNLTNGIYKSEPQTKKHLLTLVGSSGDCMSELVLYSPLGAFTLSAEWREACAVHKKNTCH